MDSEQIKALKAKLKPVSMETITKENGKVEATLRKGRSSGGYTETIRVKDGINVFRIFPSHPNKNGLVDNYSQPCVVCYVPAMVVERDSQRNVITNADGTNKMKLSKRAVFSQSVHGKKAEDGSPLCKDMIEEYRKLCFFKNQGLAKKENDEFLRKMNGSFVRGSSNNEDGLTYARTDVMYVKDLSSGEFGIFEAKKTVKKALDSIAAIESSSEPLGTDPFTDPEEGRAVKINYNSKAEDAGDYYKVSLDTTQELVEISGKQHKVLKQYPLSNNDIEVFSEAKPLREIYCGVFSFKDYKTQLWGIQKFDEKNDLGVFDMPEFQEICQSVHNVYYEEPVEVIEEIGEVEGFYSEKTPTHIPEVEDTETEVLKVVSRRSKLSELK